LKVLISDQTTDKSEWLRPMICAAFSSQKIIALTRATPTVVKPASSAAERRAGCGEIVRGTIFT
jgi:hypothetical protein